MGLIQFECLVVVVEVHNDNNNNDGANTDVIRYRRIYVVVVGVHFDIKRWIV